MKILFLESDQLAEYNCSNWRCVMPARALQRAGYEARSIRIEDWNNDSPESHRLCEEADIIFIQRNMFHQALGRTFYWKSLGKTLVVDLDDAYEHMTEETGSPSWNFWINNLNPDPNDPKKTVPVIPPALHMLKWGVHMAGNLSSPSKLICEDWKDYARTYWFPNYIDMQSYPRVTKHREPGRIHIGWGGSMTHLVSWRKSGAAEAVSQIVKEYPQVILVLIGDPRLERYFAIPKTNRAALGWSPQPVFFDKTCYLDIGLIPLYGEYDRRRSWIKTAEYSVLGIPWIGTDSEPTRDCDTGTRVQNTVEDWYKAIKFYLDNLPAVTQAAEANIEPAIHQFSIDEHTGDLVALFEKIIQEDKP